jgi:hypothetical protein
MFIVTTRPNHPIKLRRSGMKSTLASTNLRRSPSERKRMPLLRSLAGRAACVTINMALLKELFVPPPPAARSAKAP